VEVFSYNEIWEQIFINEAKILKTIFGDQLAAIHHIGSTSVPALKAKPISMIIKEKMELQAEDTLKKAEIIVRTMYIFIKMGVMR
jgi:GrpB-like predicted nucleotidyltransferase (UPF0157 family)